MPASWPSSYEAAQVPGPWPGPSPLPPPGLSPPEAELFWFIVIVQKEIGGVFPMWVLPGSMLGKGCGVGSIAASMVSSARVVPLGINHDFRRVGGLCAPNSTIAPAYQRSPKSAAVGVHS